jgi:hypothetical protein
VTIAMLPLLVASITRREMRQLASVLLPIFSVELAYRDTLNRARVETTHIDTVTVGIRARHIERLDAANFAEKMPGNAGVESIRRQLLFALKKLKGSFRHDQVEKTALGADRAIALCRLDLGGRQHFEPNLAAMTPTLVFDALNWLCHRLEI